MTVRVSGVLTRNVVAVHEGTPVDVARKTLLARGFLALLRQGRPRPTCCADRRMDGPWSG